MFDQNDFDDDEFPGGVFSQEIDGGRAGAHVRLGDRGIRARTSEGREFVVPYEDCQIEMGGASGRMLFCRTGDRSLTIFTEDRRFPAALQRAASGGLFERVDELLASGRRRHRRNVLVGWGLVLGLLVCCVGGYFALVVGARAAVVAVPFSVDEKIGEAVTPSVLEEFGDELKDDEVDAFFQKLIDRLAPHTPLPDAKFRILFLDTDDVNAVALPGGTIMVFRGLIDAVETPEQLASIIGHEMIHVTNRHALRRIAQSVGLIAAVEIMIGDVGGIVALGAEVFQHAALSSYSQSDEHEADLGGARILHAAGIDPQAAAESLQAIPHLELHDSVSWLVSHPNTTARVDAIKELIATLPEREYSPLDLSLEDLRARIAVAGARDTNEEDAGAEETSADEPADVGGDDN